MTPTLQEWLAQNPRKGINDYFLEYPEAYNAPQQQKQYINTSASLPINEDLAIKNTSVDIGIIIFGLVVIAGFFLPWVHISFLGTFNLVEWNGLGLASMFKQLQLGNPWFIKTVYLIPVAALFMIVTELQKATTLRYICQITIITLAATWCLRLITLVALIAHEFSLKIQITDFLAYGFYIILLGTAYLIYNFIKEFLDNLS
jgi:hypothetical protein